MDNLDVFRKELRETAETMRAGFDRIEAKLDRLICSLRRYRIRHAQLSRLAKVRRANMRRIASYRT